MMSKQDQLPCDNANYEDGALQQEYSACVKANLDQLDKRYWKPALDSYSSDALFEQIGEDFCSPSEEIRKKAFEAVYVAYPVMGGKLMDCLDERETHRPGWRHEKGVDQHFLNRGMDTFTKLYMELVIRGAFKPKGRKKDPRPYIHQTITNWTKNQYRKNKRLTYLGDEDWETLMESPPDTLARQLSASSAEEESLREIGDETFSRELIQAGYLSEREFDLLYALCVEEWNTEELAQRIGVTPGAIRKRKSVYLGDFLDNFILRRDAYLAYNIATWEGTPKSIFNDRPEWFINRIEEALRPALRASSSFEKGMVALPLTAGIGKQVGRLYIFSDPTSGGFYSHLPYDYVRGAFYDHLLAYPASLRSDKIFDMFILTTVTFRGHRYQPTGHYMLDKIIEQVQECGGTTWLKIGLLDSHNNDRYHPSLDAFKNYLVKGVGFRMHLIESIDFFMSIARRLL